MDTQPLQMVTYGVGFAVVFFVTFFAGDVAGLVIERRNARHWSEIGEQMGFEFDGLRRQYPDLSRIILPKLLWPETQESAFVFGESLKSLSGRIGEFEILVTDFTVWNYFVRGPLVFRGTVCVVTTDAALPADMGIVRPSSVFLHGFLSTRSLRPYSFPHDKRFSAAFCAFAPHGSPPWVFTPELRIYCAAHSREIDSVYVGSSYIVVVSMEQRPDVLPDLVRTCVGLMTRIIEGAPRIASG
jgi:hypothetical protein